MSQYAERKDLIRRLEEEAAARCEAEARFLQILQGNPDAVAITRVADGHFLEVNEAFEKLTGFRREEVLGRTSESLYLWSHGDRPLLLESLLQEGRLCNFEAQVREKSGAMRACLVNACVITYQGEECLYVMTRDVTEQKTMEAELHVIQERISKTFYASQDAIVITTVPEGRIVEVNDSFTRISEYARSEAVGRTTRELALWVHSEDRNLILHTLREKGQVRRLITDFRTKSGAIRTCTISGELITRDGQRLLLSVVEDITEQKRAEEREKGIGRILEESLDEIYIFDADSLRFIQVNRGGRENLQYTMDELLDLTPVDIKPSFSRAEFEALLRPLRTGEQEKIVFETVHRRKDGTTYPVEVHLRFAQLGKRAVFVAIILDITEQLQAEIERERFVRELEEKNAELERFTYTVSHDLKSPLVTIKGFIGLLKNDLEKGRYDRVMKDFERIERAADTMASILDELLELSRIGHILGAPERIDLVELIREAVEQISGRIEEGRVAVTVGTEMPPVRGDRVRLLEVFQNLIDNAVKFMGDQPRPRVEIGARRQGEGEVLCWVRDNGMGIDARYHEKVFDLFERLNNRVEGTGIGLALVKRIVEVHGGRIWVESGADTTGATFYFTLPAGEAMGDS